MNWTADRIRQLRYRLGLSQAEMARSLKVDSATFSSWERGMQLPEEEHRNHLLSILHQAENNAERIQRRPIAEVIMRDRGLCQIHDFEVQEGMKDSADAPSAPSTTPFLSNSAKKIGHA